MLIAGWARTIWLRLRVTLLVAGVSALSLIYQVVPGLGWIPRIFIAVAIVILTGFIEYRRKNESGISLQQKRSRLFDYFCKGYIEELREEDDTARIMVLAVEWWPTERTSSLRNVFSRYMEGASDQHLGLNVTQGVCGEAVTDKSFVVGDLEAEHAATYRLTDEQKEKTKGLTLVMSMPVMGAVTGDDGEPTTTDEVIGVINIDSQKSGAYAFYTAEREGRSLLERQKGYLGEISEIGSFIMS
jgi:hypothetical protein